jgi:hypothetical protein
MRLSFYVGSAILLCGMTTVASAKPHATFQLMKTTWTYADHGKKARESIDADGNYIEQTVGGKHLDHGTAVMKDGKACFTSAMTKDGEMCWTTHPVAVGHSMNTVNDKGHKLTVHRAAYMPLEMPK